MAVSYLLLLILTGITGIRNVIVVTNVSVKAGGSITIPCLYDPFYKTYVKYLCEGKFFTFCNIVVKTNQESSSEKFSIYDDIDQGTFTVTINDLTNEDMHFWCAVEIDSKPDIKQYFRLSVTTGVQSLYVNKQEMMVFKGGSVTIVCRYNYPKITKWCKLGTSCLTDDGGSLDKMPVSINTSVPNVFSVTMSELRLESSGWYLCSTEDFQMPVHITVRKFISTTTTTVSPHTLGTLLTTRQHNNLVTSNVPQTAKPLNSTIVGTGEDSLQNEAGLNSSTKVIVIITTLLLLLLGPTAFFGWKIIRYNKTKHEEPDITADSQNGSASEVPYATIVHKKRVAAQKKNPLPEESVTYSSIMVSCGANVQEYLPSDVKRRHPTQQ